ncbi:noggin-like isoform X2 [Thrips palmi]|nr:noggin-like isoform X2 [Thrips palmi]
MRLPAGVGPLLCPSPQSLQSLLCVLLALAALTTTPTPADGLQQGLQQGLQHDAPPQHGQHGQHGLQGLRGALRTALSPERQGLRPGGGPGGLSSSLVPVPALLERPDRLFDPTPGDLNATLLRARLGRHFDPRVMSVQRPSRAQRRQHKIRYTNLLDSDDSALLDDDQVELDEDSPFRRNPRGRLVPAGVMPESIASLDLRGVRLPDGSRLRTRIPARLRRKLQHFLWAYTACPVQRRWRDLGVRFWPRWLKEGRCPETPCSIPAGMHCKPSASRHQLLLRWHCRPLPTLVLQHAQHDLEDRDEAGAAAPTQDLEQQAARHCAWIKVEYPVITECSCGCAEDRYS